MADETSASVSDRGSAANDSNSSATINGDAAIFDGTTAPNADIPILDAASTDVAHTDAASTDVAHTDAASTDAANTDAANGGAQSATAAATVAAAAAAKGASNEAAVGAASSGAASSKERIGAGDGIPGDGDLDGVTAAETTPASALQASREQHRHEQDHEQDAANREAAHRREESRRRAIEKQSRIESEMRRMMSRLGCDDTSIQDAIIAYIADETRARRPLRDQSRRLFQALRAPSDDATTPDLESLLADFRVALEQDKARHQIGEAALDGRINFKSNPRLEAMLLLFGVIGDGPPFYSTREFAPQAQIQSDEKRGSAIAPSVVQNAAAPDANAKYPASTAGTTTAPK